MEFPVRIPSPLRSYTGGEESIRAAVDLPQPSLGDLLAALDADYPGIRFRIFDEQRRLRPHIQIFVNGAVQRNPDAQLPAGADIMIVSALSGG
jgi:molybdopterin synthase sulfur carrier subunit